MKKTKRKDYQAPLLEEMTALNEGIVCESPSDFNPVDTESFIEDEAYGW